MSFQRDCTSCGLTVHDLPLEALVLDEETALELFFERDDGGDLYCQGCAAAGQGVFL